MHKYIVFFHHQLHFISQFANHTQHRFLFLIQMKPLAFFLFAFWPLRLHLIFLCSVNLLLVTASASGNETDHWALLKFKESISNDPYDILASWNSSTHFCSWPGITCSHRHRQRITRLNLDGYGLRGFLSPHVGNLSFMRILSLENNSFYGTIPQELGRLFRLRQLWLSNNSLVGEIPYNLTNCSELWGLSLERNSLIGNIPMEIGNFHKLEGLYLSYNNFTGKFPASIWNLSSLRILSASHNHLEGNIPEEISLLNLTVFTVSANQLSGTLPSSLSNISSLKWFSIDENKFNGFLPSNMFLTLPNLLIFEVANNLFSGPIPASIVNASKLLEIEMSYNSFVGQVPNLGVLPDLSGLNLGENNLGHNSSQDWEFLKSLVNCTELTVVYLFDNNFGGPLPDLIGNLSNQLTQLYLRGNQIYGTIPATLGNLINLIILRTEINKFTGNIPDTFGRLQKMQELSLWGNKFSGKIPAIIGNLHQLFLLDLSQNMLEGNIPPSIGNCKNLQNLDLSQNNLKGPIPPQVVSLPSSILLNLSQNSLSGSLPTEVGKLENIYKLDVSENHFSGDIPGTIGDCSSLEYLYLQGNFFQGSIPSSISSLKGLQLLDLSRNNMSGSIPKGLQDISGLKQLNISFNMLEGELPKGGVFQNASALSIYGNDKLCGGILELHLPPCPSQGQKQSKHHNLIQIIIITIVVGSILLLSFVLAIYWVRRRTMKSSLTPPTIDQFFNVSYQSLHRATNGFSDSNLIGSGCYGLVYKGNLESEENLVAIKVLNLQKKGGHKSFIAECNVVKNIRHRNLVKTLTCCSSADYKGLEFKALVFEYMTNGSLEQWLHPWMVGENQPRTLDLNQRLNILFDIASALHYLHCECEQPIIHCDLKPSNVLLDEDMVAHVSDFGLARILSTLNSTSHEQTSTIEIKGTIGYAPPEYGMGSEVSLQGDLYSFGILILEIFTGRRPTDEMFKDGHNIHDYVKMAFPNNLLQIVDLTLVRREESREEGMESLTIIHPKEEKCLVSLFGMGLACSVESPRERLNVVDVMRELNLIRRIFLARGINRD